ncbi:MAG: hypothetical protein IJB96_04320 [Lachnospira sp.]|nr:hypothetical protein [Lachnospira sp.]
MQNNNYNMPPNNQYNQGFDNGYESGYNAAMQMQQQMSAGAKKPNKTAIVIKSIIIYIVAGIIVLYAIGLVGVAIDEFGDDTADALKWCERNYNNMNYSSLDAELTLYGSTDEKFDKYWEFMKGYELYTECQQWVMCEKEGVENSTANLTDRIQELEQLAKETKFSTNQKLFEEFVAEINGLRQ